MIANEASLLIVWERVLVDQLHSGFRAQFSHEHESFGQNATPRRHKALPHSDRLVEHFVNRRQPVGRERRAGNDLVLLRQTIVTNSMKQSDHAPFGAETRMAFTLAER